MCSSNTSETSGPGMADEAALGVDLQQNIYATLRLLWDRRNLIHRHVQTVQFRDDFSVGIRTSSYLTLPESVCGDDLAVPLAFCSRHRLFDFSLTDESGRVLPMATFPQSIELTARALVAAVHEMKGYRAVDGDALDAIRKTLMGESQESEQQNARPAWLAERMADPRFKTAMNLASRFFVMYAVLSDARPGARRVLKYSYDAPFKLNHGRYGLFSKALAWFGISPSVVSLEVHTSLAESYHLEVEPPPGLILSEGTLESVSLDSGVSIVIDPSPEWNTTKEDADAAQLPKHRDNIALARVGPFNRVSRVGYGKRLHFHVRHPYHPPNDALSFRVLEPRTRSLAGWVRFQVSQFWTRAATVVGLLTIGLLTLFPRLVLGRVRAALLISAFVLLAARLTALALPIAAQSNQHVQSPTASRKRSSLWLGMTALSVIAACTVSPGLLSGWRKAIVLAVTMLLILGSSLNDRLPNAPPEEIPSRLVTWIGFRIRRLGWLLTAWVASALVAGTIGLLALYPDALKQVETLKQTESSGVREVATAILLAAAGTVAGFFSRPSRHPVTARIRFIPSVALAVSALAAYAKSFDLLVFPGNTLEDYSVGGYATTLSFVAAGLLTLFVLGPGIYWGALGLKVVGVGAWKLLEPVRHLDWAEFRRQVAGAIPKRAHRPS